MPMQDGRWTTVTESEFEHERRGLEAIRKRLPDHDPWRAWSNFTFTASSGHVREVDLLVIAPGGVCLIELKDWHGGIHLENGSWVQTMPNGRRRFHSSALHLASKKARELSGLLRQQRAQLQDTKVWIAEAVCFTDAKLQIRLPAHDQTGVYTVEQLVTMLQAPPRDERHRVTAGDSKRIVKALAKVGIARSDAQYKVGPYMLDRKAIDSGRTWTDYLARHTELPEHVRIRLFLSERGSTAQMRSSTENAARREAAVLRRFRHPGAVQFKHYDPSGHSAGPALIFDYHPETLRLDEYLVQYGDRLNLTSRLALIRQLAETVRSAHSKRIYHRALAARSIHVIPHERGPEGKALGEEARWLTPHLQISDWQIAAQRSTSASLQGTTRFAPTALSAQHIAEDSDPYLAPELTALKADPVKLDVYGLGVLAYLLVTGQAPAASQAELLTQLEAGQGLRPSALVDGLSDDIDDLVQAATAYNPGRRLVAVDDFLEMLEYVEETLREQSSSTTASAEEPDDELTEDKDPLEAAAGDVLAGRWEVRRRLGTGSTSRALLVRDLQADSSKRGARSLAVLKIALNDARHDTLVREAEVMGRLRADSRVIRLVEPEPLRIGGRTVLALEYVGDERAELDESGKTGPRRREDTVARQLRDNGRLSMDQLEAYGDYLFGAVDFLEGEGVWHRDIKPDNIAVRVRPNGTRQLVLLDFSLAGYPAKQTDAGTDGYLDPFIGTLIRSVYDAHAERYALAVTLHEMASNELPKWGDGSVTPRQTDPEEWPYPTIATDAFESELQKGLTAFFRKALHRDAPQRFRDLKPMRDAWKRIFLDASSATTSSHRPVGRHDADAAASTRDVGSQIAPAEAVDAQAVRDQQAAAATRGTHLSVAGLSPAALSFLYTLKITKVGELLDYSRRKLLNAPGLGNRTLREIQERQAQWNKRLGHKAASPLSPEGRKAAKDELAELADQASEAEGALGETLVGQGLTPPSSRALRTVSLDALVSILVPELKPNGINQSEVDVVRLLLRLPDEHGAFPDTPAWPKQKDVAEAVGLSQGRIPQILKDQRRRWSKHRAVRELRAEILELLEHKGRVASAAEIADAIAVSRGTTLPERAQRRALALAAVRAVVEAEAYEPRDAGFRHAPNRHADDPARAAGLLALAVREDDAPDTPSAPGLLDYALRLGRKADKLADLESLPTAATVLAELAAIAPPPGTLEWDERRIVELAAAASTRAAATPRLEIHPRKLPLVRALRLTQAGLVRISPGVPEERQPGLTAEEVHERVRARFPERLDEHGNSELPTGPKLTRALKDAGFNLRLATRADTKTLRYLPERSDLASSQYTSTSAWRRLSTDLQRRPSKYDDDPLVASAARADEQLLASVQRDGFRVLTVRQERSPVAENMLTDGRFGARKFSVTRFFLDEMRGLLTPGAKPTWKTLVKADAARPDDKGARKFRAYAATAWGRIEPRLREELESASDDGSGPLLLTDATVFARYDSMSVLDRLAETARQGGRGLWLLVPQAEPAREPRLGTTAVPYQAGLGEWIVLSDSWVANLHRAEAGAVGDRTKKIAGTGAGK